MKTLLVWLLVFSTGNAFAQATSPETEQPPEIAEQQEFRDQLGRDTPRGSICTACT